MACPPTKMTDDKGPSTSKKHEMQQDSDSEDVPIPHSSESSMKEEAEERKRMEHPKEIYKGGLSDLIRDQGILVEHFLGWEGGLRNKQATEENSKGSQVAISSRCLPTGSHQIVEAWRCQENPKGLLCGQHLPPESKGAWHPACTYPQLENVSAIRQKPWP